jgi:hypothetical protein
MGHRKINQEHQRLTTKLLEMIDRSKTVGARVATCARPTRRRTAVARPCQQQLDGERASGMMRKGKWVMWRGLRCNQLGVRGNGEASHEARPNLALKAWRDRNLRLEHVGPKLETSYDRSVRSHGGELQGMVDWVLAAPLTSLLAAAPTGQADRGREVGEAIGQRPSPLYG